MTSYESTTRRMPTPDLGACTLIEDLLPLYIEGEVSPSSRDLIVEHLAHCEHCAGFLAGAHSVRAHLRGHTQPRPSAAGAGQPTQYPTVVGEPTQPTPIAVHQVLLAIGMLGTCAFATVGNLMLQDDSRLASVGLLIILLCLGALALLGRTRGRWTVARAATLGVTYLIGCAASMMLRFMGQEPVAMIMGPLLGLIALSGIWRTLWNNPGAKTDLVSAIVVYPLVLVGAICLVLGAFIFTMSQIIPMTQTLAIMLLLLGVGLFLWQREQKPS